MFGIRGSKYKIATIVLLILLQQQYIKAQLIDMSSSGGGGSIPSPIWGASPFQNGGADDGMIDPNWGVLPSQQGNNVNMWGQQIGMNNPNQQQQTQLLDIYGNPVLMDQNGNVLYDAQGNPLVDSVALNNMGQVESGGILPPPDDPIDIPLDGGVVVLLTIATGMGYKNRRLKV
jgi:hypothetical protein